MSIIKEIGLGLLVLAILAGTAMIAASIVTEHYRGEGIKPTPVENTAAESELGFWETHDLNAIPGLENAATEDLPTAEEVLDTLQSWEIWNNVTMGEYPMPADDIDWHTSDKGIVLRILKSDRLEYHTDENGKLHVDSPGISLISPAESKSKEYKYFIGTHGENGYIGAPGTLWATRFLENELEVPVGIAGFYLTKNWANQAKVIVPVKNGLGYFDYRMDNEVQTVWENIEYVINPSPGNRNKFFTKKPGYPKENVITRKIRLHWRLGESKYVEWDYVLENSEPTMIWPENGEPVGWMIQ